MTIRRTRKNLKPECEEQFNEWLSKYLKPECEEQFNEWLSKYQFESGCTCFKSAPCSYCTHPGNPNNLAEDDDAWEIEIIEEPKQYGSW